MSYMSLEKPNGLNGTQKYFNWLITMRQILGVGIKNLHILEMGMYARFMIES